MLSYGAHLNKIHGTVHTVLVRIVLTLITGDQRPVVTMHCSIWPRLFLSLHLFSPGWPLVSCYEPSQNK